MKFATITNSRFKTIVAVITFIAFIFFITSCSNNNKVKTELYFGLSNEDGAITQTEWNTFKEKTIDKTLNGYTLINGDGYWKTDNTEFKEKSIILIYLHEDTPAEERKINTIISTYKEKFNQESVLRVDQAVHESL